MSGHAPASHSASVGEEGGSGAGGRQRGQPLQPVGAHPAMSGMWCVELNKGLKSTLGSSSAKPCFWYRKGRQQGGCRCVTFMTIKAVRRAVVSGTRDLRPGLEGLPASITTCPVCDGGGSALEQLLYAELKGMGWRFCAQVKPLGGSFGPVDCMVYDAGCGAVRLLVQADGTQHTHKGMHQTSLAQQQERDARADSMGVELGWHVVRLHHADCGSAAAIKRMLHAALDCACDADARGSRVIWRSPSYTLPHHYYETTARPLSKLFDERQM